MLVECGFVRATASDGREWSFTPSFGRIAGLGHPHEIVALYAGLHGPRAAQDAAYVLAGLCDQDDPSPLIGWTDEAGHHPGAMPEAEMIIIARHLMRHGICGKASPGEGEGSYSTTFQAAEFVMLARVHLGMSQADAEALSMTELQGMLAIKFPAPAKDVPDLDEYEATMALIKD